MSALQQIAVVRQTAQAVTVVARAPQSANVIAGTRGVQGPAGATGATGIAGAAGAPGVPGPKGDAGAPGQIRYTGSGPPSSIAGANPNDTYLDVLTGTIYTLT